MAGPRPEHGLSYDRPAETWDEGLPLGNGLLGALVWGDGRPLKISLDRTDLWDLTPIPEFHAEDYRYRQVIDLHRAGRHDALKRMLEDPYSRPAPTKIPAGRIELTAPDGAGFVSAALDLAAARAEVVVGRQVARVRVDALKPVGLIQLSGHGWRLELVPPPFAEPAGDDPRDLGRLGYPAPERLDAERRLAFRQSAGAGLRYAVCLAWREAGDGVVAAWTVAVRRDDGDPAADALALVTDALAGDDALLEQRHCGWWDNYWRRSTVSLPDPVIERQWYLEQYKFGAASRRGAPPITLQGPWTADDGMIPPWKADYHHDLNTQLSYWPCYAGNRLDEGLSFLDWLWATRDHCRDWTRRFFDLPGLCAPMTADLLNRQIGGWRQYTHSTTTAAWLAHHFYLHWRYSGEREFLAERAWPYLREAAVFLEAVSSERDAKGFRTLPLSASPEIHGNRPEAWFETITNYDLALMQWLFGATAELAQELGQADEAARWRAVAAELPPLAYGDDGRLLVCAGTPLHESHRHFSHLMAIHPLGLIDRLDGPDAERTIAGALAELDRLGPDLWCGYSYSWLAGLAARAGDGSKAAEALRVFSTAFCLRNSFHVNGDQTRSGYSTFTYRPFTLEGNFAAAAGVQEMLLQSQRGLIRLFPAVPDDWTEVSFTTLRAEGAFLVSSLRRRGRVAEVTIISERGGTCRLLSPWTGGTIILDLKPGEHRTLTA